MIIDILSRPDAEASQALERLGFEDGATALKNLRSLGATPLRRVLDRVAEASALSPSPDGALNNLETIIKGPLSGMPDVTERLVASGGRTLEDLITVCGSSPFLSNILGQDPSGLERLFLDGALNETKDGPTKKRELLELVSPAKDLDTAARALRVYKKREYLRVGARDLLGLAPFEEVALEISDLADASLEAAVAFGLASLRAAYGAPLHADPGGPMNLPAAGSGVSGGNTAYQGSPASHGELNPERGLKEAEFAVIGLGKLGGRELNFSSDVDIIYIYSSDKGETAGVEGRDGSRISLHSFFVKLSTIINRLIGGVTEDGFVFRVDLDLRPEGRAGDLANSLRSAEIYYESWGASWERAAMIKARPVAGSEALGGRFIEMIRPFVFRRYLDFTAIEEVKAMKERIDASAAQRRPGTVDVKLGRGGIREVEFFCQALELIHGGKDPAIRERGTLRAIERLFEGGYIKDDAREALRDGYVFLRRLEHRIQIVDGMQTQAIPAVQGEIERLARMMGFKDSGGIKAGARLWEEYGAVAGRVHAAYRSLFYREGGLEAPGEVLALFSPETTGEEAEERLSGMGFKEPSAAYENLVRIRSGGAHPGPRARLLAERLAPLFLARALDSPDPDLAMNHLERFIASVGARTTFYALMAENPLVVEELMRIFGTSEFLSRTLIERPEGLELLLSRELSTPYRTGAGIRASALEAALTRGDYEERLDALRAFRAREVFRVGINDLRGALTQRQVSRQMTSVAEACLEAAYRIALAQVRARHGDPGPCGFSIIGLGKLGGAELGYGSDLDIVFVYSGCSGEERTSGPTAISSHEFFVRLGQRVISALTLRTREGIVFNVDTRLRPSGSAGPLVVSRGALAGYHAEKTRVWERQAFTKARAIAGDIEAGRSVLRELGEIIYSKGLSPDDAAELKRIRSRMEAEIAGEDPSRFNIKTGRGGVVDIEFLVQALQLRHGKEKPHIRTPDTLKALSRLSKAGILDDGEKRLLKEAYVFLRRLEGRLRIVHDRPDGYLARAGAELRTLARRSGYSGADPGERLLKEYSAAASRVRALFLERLDALAGEDKRA
jgi:glutamate-ammonia-ligase adenylyltransferase